MKKFFLVKFSQILNGPLKKRLFILIIRVLETLSMFLAKKSYFKKIERKF